ncbi:MAG: hypothetical protein QOH03_1362, partial [Kribbellaceae bacterium]|nr:hypothetical protein [Kribbellaceae bacterium]
MSEEVARPEATTTDEPVQGQAMVEVDPTAVRSG